MMLVSTGYWQRQKPRICQAISGGHRTRKSRLRIFGPLWRVACMHLWLRVPDVDDADDEAPRDDEEGPEESKVGGGEESK